MNPFYRIILWDQKEEMRFLGVLCLLSAAVALPTPEQLHTNLPVLPPASELKSDEKDKSSDEKVALEISQPQIEEELEKSDESKSPSQSEEKPKVEKDEDKEKHDDIIKEIQKESEETKESKEAKVSKEKSKESKEAQDSKEKSKESNEPWESKPEEPKKEKKEKDSKSEESREKDDDELPVIIQIISRPKDFFYDLFSKWFPNTKPKWPFGWWGWRNGDLQDQPIYIVRESDFDLD